MGKWWKDDYSLTIEIRFNNLRFFEYQGHAYIVQLRRLITQRFFIRISKTNLITAQITQDTETDS